MTPPNDRPTPTNTAFSHTNTGKMKWWLAISSDNGFRRPVDKMAAIPNGVAYKYFTAEDLVQPIRDETSRATLLGIDGVEDGWVENLFSDELLLQVKCRCSAVMAVEMIESHRIRHEGGDKWCKSLQLHDVLDIWFFYVFSCCQDFIDTDSE